MYVNGLNFDFSIHDDEDICKKSKLLIQHLPKTPMQSMYADQVEKVFTTQDWRTIRQVLIMLSGDGLTEAVVQHAGSKIVAAQCQIEIDPCSDLLTLLPCLLACLPGWSSRALGISCWAYFKVLCILADYRHSGHASLFISHEKTGWPLLESPSRNSKWSHHGIKQQSRSIVTLRSIDLTVRSRSIAPMEEDDIGLLAPHSW